MLMPRTPTALLQLYCDAPLRCLFCGEDRPQIHHMDGDYTNNAPENLMPLCTEHHPRGNSRYEPFLVKVVERLSGMDLQLPCWHSRLRWARQLLEAQRKMPASCAKKSPGMRPCVLACCSTDPKHLRDYIPKHLRWMSVVDLWWGFPFANENDWPPYRVTAWTLKSTCATKS